MNWKTFIITNLLFASMVSCAQQKYGIRKVDAFFSEYIPGNIRVDPQGNPIYRGPDTSHIIYIETKDNSIKWTTAWKNDQSYMVVTTAIIETPLEVGIKKINDEKILLRPAPGNKLWRLDLVKAETPSKAPARTGSGEIILQGKSGKKTILQRIGRLTELSLPPSV